MPFSNPVVGGDTLIRNAIQSQDYVAGVSGWAIKRDGTAEFNNVTVRGTFEAISPSGAYVKAVPTLVDASITINPPNTGGVVYSPAKLSATNGIPKLIIEGAGEISPTLLGGGQLILGARPGLGTNLANILADEIELTNGNYATGFIRLLSQKVTIGVAGSAGITHIDTDSTVIGVAGNAGTAHIASDSTTIDGTISWGASAGTQQTPDTAVTSGTTTSTVFVNSLTTTGIRGIAFTAPPSGKVAIDVTCGAFNNTIGSFTLTSFEVRTGNLVGLGAVVQASDENTASQFQSAAVNQPGQHHVIGTVAGLIPGTLYNACITCRVTANTGSWNRRLIRVTPAL